jgi:membrane fusion protein, heavy metal efflux system
LKVRKYMLFKKSIIYFVIAASSLMLANLPLTLLPSHCYAHGGADHIHHEHKEKHQDSSRPNSKPSIRKIPNGMIVPQDIQTHLGIITAPVTEQTIQATARLIGRAVSDPSGYTRLQATQNARVLNDPEYPFPLDGQKVKKDQVLLALQPTLSKVESSDQRSILYKAESEIVQLKREVERKEKLGQFATQKELENARSELERAIKQKEEIINKTFQPEYMISPLDGIVADLHVRPGEIVTPNKTIIEIVDPKKLLIEAYVFDPIIADNVVGGVAILPLNPKIRTSLKVIGVSPKVGKEDQAIHIIFKAEDHDPAIKIDMAVEVLADLKTHKQAIVIPKKALTEDTKGSWVFIRKAPELFEMKKIQIGRTIGEWIVIEEGLSIGEQIVIDGAYLLKQAM